MNERQARAPIPSAGCRQAHLLGALVVTAFLQVVALFAPSPPGAAQARQDRPAQAARGIEVVGLRRLDETTFRDTQHGFDNWHMTWAEDGNQYALGCDGQGYNTRLWKLVGSPPHVRFEAVPGYPALVSRMPPLANRYYGFGILAVGRSIYHYLSTPNHVFHEPGARFVGAKLIYSPDGGQSWRNQHGGPVTWEPWDKRNRHNMVFFEEPGECFSLLSMLQMGRGYTLNRDGYVYVYAPNGNAEGSMNQLVLFRVPRGKILDRGAYEFFVARSPDGSARWSKRIQDRGVVHTFPSGWVNKEAHPYSWHPSVVYNPGLRKFLMANWGMGTDGTRWFTRPSYLGFWVAEQPWGPWQQIHEERAWAAGGNRDARAYQPQIAPAWIAPDGKSFWLVWTEWGKFYCFNCQKVEILTRGG